MSLALDGILSFSTKILTLLMLGGISVCLISIGLIAFVLIDRIFTNTPVQGYTSIMITISFFSGIIIFILGFIGAYVERILLEVKNRPSFIVKETFGIDV